MVERSLEVNGRRGLPPGGLLPEGVAELLRPVGMAVGRRERRLDDRGVDVLARRAEPLLDEGGERIVGDDAELHLLGASPERLVGVVEQPVHHAALATEVDVRDLRLRLERRSHQVREVRVDPEHLLELVEDDRHPPAAVRRQLARQVEELLDRRVDVGARVPGREAEPECAVGRVDGHHRQDPEPAEDLRRALPYPEERARDLLVDRLRELRGELLLGRRAHQVDLSDERPVPAHELLGSPPHERRLAVAPGGEHHHVLAVQDVRLELGELPLAVGERLVEREIAEAERVPRSHPVQCSRMRASLYAVLRLADLRVTCYCL